MNGNAILAHLRTIGRQLSAYDRARSRASETGTVGPPSPATFTPPSEEFVRRLEFEARMAEYSSLREESLQAISNRVQIMNFTFTSLTIILASLMAASIPVTLVLIVSLIFVPVACKVSALVWLGEYNRSQRAGSGIRQRKDLINELIRGVPAVSWENDLYSKGTHMGYPYAASLAFMLSTGIFGEALGGYTAAQLVHGLIPTVGVIAITVTFSLLFEIWFIRFFIERWVGIRMHSHQA